MVRVRLVATPERLTHRARMVVASMDSECFPSDDPYPIEGAYWWIAEEDGQPVAFAGLKLLDEGFGFLCRAGVLPAGRGRGLQRRLIRARMSYARRIGIRSLCTYTVPDNPVSSNNLIRCGFQLYRPPALWAGGECLYWWKDL